MGELSLQLSWVSRVLDKIGEVDSKTTKSNS